MRRFSIAIVLVVGFLWGAVPTGAKMPWPPAARISNGSGSQPGGVYTATWTRPAGKNQCVTMHGDGVQTWNDALSQPAGEPADIVFPLPLKPRKLKVFAYRGVDPVGPIGTPEELPYELWSRRDDGVREWVATIHPTVIADLYLEVFVAWRGDGRCGGPGSAGYTFHLSNV
jgi:hypothetical protein